MLKRFINSLKRPENANLIEAIQKGYKACFEDIHDYYEIQKDSVRDVARAAVSAKEGEIQPWHPIPLNKIKPIWEDFMKYGFVRKDKYVEELAKNIINKISIIHANTYLTGHTNQDPKDDIEDALGRELNEEEYEEFLDKLGDYIYDGERQYRISDYAMDDLENLAIKMTDTFNASELILLIDQVLNIAHMRNDLAAMFVQGGREALDELSGHKTKDPEKEGAVLESVTFKTGKEPIHGKWQQITPLIDNKPAGRLIFGETPEGKIWIEQIDTNKELRRQGIAEETIKKLKEMYPKKELIGIPKNTASENLFEKMGIINELDVR